MDYLKRSTSMDCRPDLYRVYGSKVFREAVIRERLSKSIYDGFLKTIELGRTLDVSIAPEVAKAMMQWAIEQGATHYAHWFLPMTNNTACKHDSFFVPSSLGEAMLEFPSSTLVRGEPDASSFPSGGLRETFEARGYTTWDPTSPAFVRDGTLFIPSVFLSYTGEALDQKVPLLKSVEAVNKAGLRFLKFFPKLKNVKRVTTCAGAEQEYFIVDRGLYKKRMDLQICGRTLLGLLPSKGQQLEDHYMANINTAISNFMADLDNQLWEIGVPAKTKHNEAAPAQHELAPVYEHVNLASDHNQMTMEMMRTVAKKRGLACLLHEKPFSGVNGSGKHNNFSVVTDSGYNLLNPKHSHDDDMLFVLTICAFIRCVDLYSDILRMTAASSSNDQRLGGFEAPPPILSIFLGETITDQLFEVGEGTVPKSRSHDQMKIVPSLPNLDVDDSDRNRTSPMAFTGNKFEFRMLGSSQSIAQVNTVLDSMIADSFNEFADRLEKAENIEEEKKKIVSDVLAEHGKIIFNGNNYSKEWAVEAERRGLPSITNAVDAFEAMIQEKNISLFERVQVFSRQECLARYEIEIENYIKTVSIEASTLIQMVERQVIPAIETELGRMASSYNLLKKAGIENKSLKNSLQKLSDLYESVVETNSSLEEKLEKSNEIKELKEKAEYLRDTVLPQMTKVREPCDKCEAMMSPESWPFPSYNDLFHST
ncbi:Glutamine synthetase, catalytic domain containing protein [Tritrichomonas foetus]|uniref:Glutamine synthetase, catalytic domain containing protein n=1 Tax=Tritrichomonas foetus TaxID=1144522 RepID=A0A1J4KR22_9EUKA|nr:Glutamine synthetase, catalytic domain containing protein [Tritrichomonas foetus]|eukprot:OHT13376.1 Glutamine synthetase, catalytic domain containing protein [Tritrichomonas foetus]